MNNIKSQDYASIMAKALGASEWIEINSRDPGAGGKALTEISDKAQSRLLALANSARAASYVSAHPTAIGVFGASQVGKSFLVNTLAAGGEHITTNWGGVDILFRHCNTSPAWHRLLYIANFSPVFIEENLALLPVNHMIDGELLPFLLKEFLKDIFLALKSSQIID